MIQDIKPYVYDVTYRQEDITDDSFVCFKNNGKILLSDTEGENILPTYEMVKNMNLHYTYLFTISGQKFFYADNASDVQIPGYTYQSKNTFRTLQPRHLAFGMITACQITDWYEANKFCGKCGAPMRHSSKERMLRCDNCKNMVFPKICPSIIVAVTNGEKLLMTKRSPSSDHYSLIAGFMEVGETAEDTIHREVYEETGVRVKNIKYYKSQPWSFSDSVLFAFTAELDGSDEIAPHDNELSSAEWIDRKDIKDVNQGVSITNELICAFKDGII